MHQLVFEQLDDLLPGEMDLELGLGHQAQTLVVDRTRARVAPLVERGLQRLAVAAGQLQRTLAEQADGEAVVVDRAAVRAGDRREPDLFLDVAPEARQHAGQRGHRIAADRFEDFLCAGAAQRAVPAGIPAVVVHTGRFGVAFGGEWEPRIQTTTIPERCGRLL